MAPVVILTLAALAAALVVVLVAGRRELRTWWGDLRALAGSRDRVRRVGVLSGARRDLEDAADGDAAPLDDLFSLGATDGPAYLDADRLLTPLGRLARTEGLARSDGDARDTGAPDSAEASARRRAA